MRTTENSKVDIAEKTDYLVFHKENCSSYQQMRMALSTKNDTNDQFDAHLTEEFGKLSDSPELYRQISYKECKEELLHISDEMIDLQAKSLFNDCGTECLLQLDSDEVASLDSGTGTQSEVTTDPDSEGQDEEDLEAAEGGILTVPDDDLFTSQDSKNKDLSDDSCEMTYIELDLPSQSNRDVSNDELCMELMKMSLRSDSSKNDSSDPKPVKVCVDDSLEPENVQDSKLDANTEKEALNFGDDTQSIGTLNLIHSLGQEQANSNRNQKKIPKFLASILSLAESNSSLLPERTYAKIAENVLDERTPLSLGTEENYLFNTNSCRPTLNTDIPLVLFEMNSSDKDLKCSFTPDENDLTNKVCPMTYVDLNVNEPCPEDITLNIKDDKSSLCRGNPSDQNGIQTNPPCSHLDESKVCPMTYVDLDVNEPCPEDITLNIKDDKSSLCRGNPSDQNGIQTNPPCSHLDESDFEVPTVDFIDNPTFLIENVNTEMDFINGSSVHGFYSSQTFPFSSAELNFSSTMCLPPCFNEEMLSEISCSVLSPAANVNNHISCFDNNCETDFEHEFVTQNLPRLKEVSDILGLSNTESHNTIPPPYPAGVHPPLSTTNSPSVFTSQMSVANFTTMENFFPPISQSFDSNVIPRVTTQTPGTQSDAIPAVPGIFVVVSSSSIQRPPCNEEFEPIKNPFGFDNVKNSSLSEANFRKKAKQKAASFTDEQLLQFENNESCLHKAVRTKDNEYVFALLKRLSNFNSDNLDIINAKNEKSQTALHLAVQENIPAIVHQLIKHGAEVNHLAMFTICIEKKHLFNKTIHKIMITRKNDVGKTPSQKLEAPLHYAASRGIQFKLVLKCLLEANDLDINIKNSEGQTALHCAALAHGTGTSNLDQSIHSEYIIKKLLTCGAHPLIQDDSGKNVLMYAIESKDVNLVSHIIKTVSRDSIQNLLTATTSNGQTCFSLAHSLKQQYNEIQWQKLINMLTRHTFSN